MFRLLILFLTALPSFCVTAYTGHVPDWDRVDISATVDGETVRVVAEAKAGKFTSLMAVVRGKRISVPADHVANLAKPRLRTISLVSPDTKFLPGPTFYVTFHVGSEPKGRANSNPDVVTFHFGQLDYIGGTAERQLADGRTETEVWEQGKKPRRVNK